MSINFPLLYIFIVSLLFFQFILEKNVSMSASLQLQFSTSNILYKLFIINRLFFNLLRSHLCSLSIYCFAPCRWYKYKYNLHACSTFILYFWLDFGGEWKSFFFSCYLFYFIFRWRNYFPKHLSFINYSWPRVSCYRPILVSFNATSFFFVREECYHTDHTYQ